MGSAALYQLARRGIRVAGLDRFSPPHTLGSSHGQTRIIREAYFEHPLYVPLVRRAYECWQNVEEESGTQVYRKTGGLMLGHPDGPVVSGSRASALEHGILHRMLTAADVRTMFPGFSPPEAFVGLWEERAGLLFPEAAISAQLRVARRQGAVVRTEAHVLRWSATGRGVRLETAEGAMEAGMLVLAAGPWISTLTGPRGAVFQVERQCFHWFEPSLDAGGWPVALWEHRAGGLFATLPEGAGRVKAGIHHDGDVVDPETVNRDPEPGDEARIRSLVTRYQPAAAGPLLDSAVCLYTNTPDRHFVIDWHWDYDNVLLVSACSGHGFKFSSAIGEVVADLVTTGSSGFDLSSFSIRRFPASTGDRGASSGSGIG